MGLKVGSLPASGQVSRTVAPSFSTVRTLEYCVKLPLASTAMTTKVSRLVAGSRGMREKMATSPDTGTDVKTFPFRRICALTMARSPPVVARAVISMNGESVLNAPRLGSGLTMVMVALFWRSTLKVRVLRLLGSSMLFESSLAIAMTLTVTSPAGTPSVTEVRHEYLSVKSDVPGLMVTMLENPPLIWSGISSPRSARKKLRDTDATESDLGLPMSKDDPAIVTLSNLPNTVPWSGCWMAVMGGDRSRMSAGAVTLTLTEAWADLLENGSNAKTVMVVDAGRDGFALVIEHVPGH